MEGQLHKMKTNDEGGEVRYHLVLGEAEHALAPFLGQKIRFSFTGEIRCVACGSRTKKSWQQGHCYPCTLRLASCDLCIVKPELCHYARGTCREPEWGEANCMKSHVIYLANSSGLKVGITRESQVPTRWMDQGAHQALPIMRVKDRLTSGKVELLFGEYVGDKTNWQRMLRGDPDPVDLEQKRDELWGLLADKLAAHVPERMEGPVRSFRYPVLEWPAKVKSYSFEKTPVVEDRLVGIKGQYLIFAGGVMNVRSHAGHVARWETA